jgi:type III pantothenate kinase
MFGQYLKFDNWLALVIGNSRLHWAWFKHDILIETWDTQHLSLAVESNRLPQEFLASNLIKEHLTQIPVYLASVVSSQSQLWQNYAKLNLISLQDIDLKNIYPTLGLDRALAVLGAIATYNKACLVIDGGTALTFTGVDKDKYLQGGAILPGLRSQLITLNQKTADLPKINLPDTLPPRWALNTQEAIASGIIYTAIAGINSYIIDWLQQFPTSQIIFTGGDAKLLSKYLHLQFPTIAKSTIIDRNLIFWGIKVIYQR